MRCLLIEDEPGRIERILPELRKVFGDTQVDVASDRDTAMEFVERVAFDLVVLDQRIPSHQGQLDANVIHGRAVLDHVRKVAPDTPAYFLTGLPMEDDYVDHLIAEGAQCDVWGDRKPVPLNRRFQKATMGPFYQAAAEIAATARITDDIEINTKGAGIDLTYEDARILRIFTRLNGGVCADVAVLSGGFSGARVIRADVKDSYGGLRLSVASKLGPDDAISDEISRYEREIMRLPAGTYAPLVSGVVARVRSSKGAFYRLLEGYDTSLFEVLGASDQHGASCVKAIRDSQAPWIKNAITKKVRVGDLLKMLVWDDRIPGIHGLMDGIKWGEFEDKELSVRMCTRHGDLHGENVLVDAKRRAMMIDYGAVGMLPSAIDAVTVELSPFFHPHGLRQALRWSSGDGDIDWFDRQAFGALSTIPRYIEASRDWAHAEAFGDREVLACAYTYVLRQLQFPKADRDLARALAAGIVSRGLKT